MERTILCPHCGRDITDLAHNTLPFSFECECGTLFARDADGCFKKVDTAPRASSGIAAPSGGGKLSGNNYYRVAVDAPISEELQPYTAECADIIEALGMTFNEGEAFKAIWRMAAARQGRGKAGNNPQYDADKVAHYGTRIAAQTKKGPAKC